MTSLVLHIGAHKTGSSAIQEYARRNADHLTEQGVYYPVGLLQAYPGQHSDLARLLSERDTEAVERFLAESQRAAAAAGCATVFLSGEDLCAAPDDDVRTLAEFAGKHFAQIQVVLVLRNKKDWLYSQYNQHLKAATYQVTTDAFAARMQFDPNACADRWARTFGETNFTLLSYDDMRRGFVGRFIARTLGLEIAEEQRESSSNRSLDLISAQFINDVLKESPELDVAAVLQCYETAFGDYRPRFTIEQAVAEEINARYPDDPWRAGWLTDLKEGLLGDRRLKSPERLDVTRFVGRFTRFLDLLRSDVLPPEERRTVRTHGSLTITGTRALGWAYNPDEPESRVEVHFYNDRRLIREVRADIYRGDLKKAGKGDGAHGFAVELAKLLPPGRHNITAKTADGEQLKGSPVEVHVPTADVSPALDEAGGLVARQTRHGLMLLNPQDSGVDRALLTYGEWGEDELDVLRAHVEPGTVAIDVGANIGVHSLALSRAVGPEGRVYSLEPQHSVYLRLCSNAMLNGAVNVWPVEAAGSDSSGESVWFPFQDQAKPHCSGAIGAQDSKIGHGYAVTTRTLDELVEGHAHAPVSAIKIDVEGREPEVLRGAERVIARDRPLLYIECISRDLFDAMYPTLEKNEYYIYWHCARIIRADNHLGETTDIYGGRGYSGNLIALTQPLDVDLPGIVKVRDSTDFWPIDRFDEVYRERISTYKR